MQIPINILHNIPNEFIVLFNITTTSCSFGRKSLATKLYTTVFMLCVYCTLYIIHYTLYIYNIYGTLWRPYKFDGISKWAKWDAQTAHFEWQKLRKNVFKYLLGTIHRHSQKNTMKNERKTHFLLRNCFLIIFISSIKVKPILSDGQAG